MSQHIGQDLSCDSTARGSSAMCVNLNAIDCALWSERTVLARSGVVPNALGRILAIHSIGLDLDINTRSPLLLDST